MKTTSKRSELLGDLFVFFHNLTDVRLRQGYKPKGEDLVGIVGRAGRERRGTRTELMARIEVIVVGGKSCDDRRLLLRPDYSIKLLLRDVKQNSGSRQNIADGLEFATCLFHFNAARLYALTIRNRLIMQKFYPTEFRSYI